MAPGGGSAGWPGVDVARVNQRASSSSPSRSVIASVRATARNPSISEEGKWPWLRRVVFDVADLHAGFLEHLALDRIFKALARFDETGDGRISPCRPRGLAA
jgi:hypothetical protein